VVVRRPPLQARTRTAHLHPPSAPRRLQDHRPSTAVPADLKPGTLYLLSGQLTPSPHRSTVPPWRPPSGELPFRPTAKLSSIPHRCALVNLPTPPGYRLIGILADPAIVRHDLSTLPCFRRGPKGESGPNPLAGPGQAPLWVQPTATVPIFIFLSNYSNSILIKVQTSKIVGNCMDLIKL
jgi:hypothetical protein